MSQASSCSESVLNRKRASGKEPLSKSESDGSREVRGLRGQRRVSSETGRQ